jgi:hypothetical protein
VKSIDESNRILMDRLNGGGISVQDAADLEDKEELWFGGRGIIGVLIRRMGLGYVEFDSNTNTFKHHSSGRGEVKP